MPLVQKLFEGKIDIVGDVHGESGALHQLLFRLGYDGLGRHPEGRRLVFVGDLVDRGPDSPGVVRLVRKLVEGGAAQMVLGNHEVNLMRRERKHGNHWFWGETEQICSKSASAKVPVLAPAWPSFQILEQVEAQESYLEFFRGLPLVLERPGLTVVHAMYDKESVDTLRSCAGDAGAAHDEFDSAIRGKIDSLRASGKELTTDELDMMEQNENPVKVVTTGMEKPAAEPFYAGGKMRTLGRFTWWKHYDGSAGLVVVGHYWRRRRAEVELGIDLTGPSLFPDDAGAPDGELCSLGSPPPGSGGSEDASLPSRFAGSVVCVDYSAGLRFEERGRGLREGSLGTALAALRLPEARLYFADGDVADVR